MMTPSHPSSGFILLPVLLLIAILGASVLLLNQETVNSSQQTLNLTEIEQAKYSAEAGLALAYYELKEQASCEEFSVSTNGNFKDDGFLGGLKSSIGSLITLSVETVGGDGSSQKLSRELTAYDETKTREIIIPVAQDTYSQSTNSSKVFGDAETLHVRYNNFFSFDRHSHLQFDLSQVSVDPDLIQRARLEMHLSGSADSSNSVNVKIYRLKSAWLEAEATHIERLTGTNWSVFNDWDLSPLTSTTVDEGTIGWVSWDLQGLVVGWLKGNFPNHGVTVSGQAGVTNNLEFVSRENAETTKHPVLRITLPCECGQVCS